MRAAVVAPPPSCEVAGPRWGPGLGRSADRLGSARDMFFARRLERWGPRLCGSDPCGSVTAVSKLPPPSRLVPPGPLRPPQAREQPQQPFYTTPGPQRPPQVHEQPQRPFYTTPGPQRPPQIHEQPQQPFYATPSPIPVQQVIVQPRHGVTAGQVVLIVIGVLVLAPFATCMVCTLAVGVSVNSAARSDPSPTRPSDPVAVAEAPVSKIESTPSAAPSAPVAAPEASPFTWKYDEKKDEMTGQVTRGASVLSETTYQLGFPYGGGTHSGLRIVKHPRNGVMVTVKIDNGQLTCHSFMRCRILVRFDDRAPIKFRGTEPADNSTDLIFLEPDAQFIKEIKKSKRAAIELPFYEEGMRVFHFNTADLKWD